MRNGRFTFPKAESTLHFLPVLLYTAPSLSYTLPQCATWLSCTDPGPLKKVMGMVPTGQKTKTKSRSDHSSTHCKNKPGSWYFPTAASTAWARPLWTTHQIGVGTLRQRPPCTRRSLHSRESQFRQGSHSSMPRQSRGGQSANTCRDWSMSFQKSTAMLIGTLSCTSKRAQGHVNPPGKPSLGVLLSKDLASRACDSCWRGYSHQKAEQTSAKEMRKRHRRNQSWWWEPNRPPTQVD